MARHAAYSSQRRRRRSRQRQTVESVASLHLAAFPGHAHACSRCCRAQQRPRRSHTMTLLHSLAASMLQSSQEDAAASEVGVGRGRALQQVITCSQPVLSTRLSPPPRSPPTPQVEGRVAALCDLMHASSARLCPAAAAAAADAALALISGLQAARQRLPPPNGQSAAAAAALERSQQRLLQVMQSSLATAPGTPPPAAEQPAAGSLAKASAAASQPRAELAALVGSMGFAPSDLRAAQAALEQRTARALQPGGADAAADATTAPPASPLEALLRQAVSMPALQPGSSTPGPLHAAAAELVWASRRFPSPAGLPLHQRPQLSAEGWAAYWMLEPQARVVGCGDGWLAGMLGRLVCMLLQIVPSSLTRCQSLLCPCLSARRRCSKRWRKSFRQRQPSSCSRRAEAPQPGCAGRSSC